MIEETGGQSLSMLRALLTRWAWRTILLGERRVRPRRRYRRYVERVTPLNWTDVNIPESESILSDDQVRILRRRGSRRRLRPRDGWSNDLYGDLAEELDERQPSVALPPHIIDMILPAGAGAHSAASARSSSRAVAHSHLRRAALQSGQRLSAPQSQFLRGSANDKDAQFADSTIGAGRGDGISVCARVFRLAVAHCPVLQPPTLEGYAARQSSGS